MEGLALISCSGKSPRLCANGSEQSRCWAVHLEISLEEITDYGAEDLFPESHALLAQVPPSRRSFTALKPSERHKINKINKTKCYLVAIVLQKALITAVASAAVITRHSSAGGGGGRTRSPALGENIWPRLLQELVLGPVAGTLSLSEEGNRKPELSVR